jgi:hypothetical protein
LVVSASVLDWGRGGGMRDGKKRSGRWETDWLIARATHCAIIIVAVVVEHCDCKVQADGS